MSKVTKVRDDIRLKQWAKRICECQQSGSSVKGWCRENGVLEGSYYYYLRKLRTNAIAELPAVAEPDPKPVEFKQIQVESPVLEKVAAITIHLGHISINVPEGISQQTVETVLIALSNVKQLGAQC